MQHAKGFVKSVHSYSNDTQASGVYTVFKEGSLPEIKDITRNYVYAQNTIYL